MKEGFGNRSDVSTAFRQGLPGGSQFGNQNDSRKTPVSGFPFWLVPMEADLVVLCPMQMAPNQHTPETSSAGCGDRPSSTVSLVTKRGFLPHEMEGEHLRFGKGYRCGIYGVSVGI